MAFAASAFADRPFAALPASGSVGISVSGGTLASSSADCVVGVAQVSRFNRSFAGAPFAQSSVDGASSGTGISVFGGTVAANDAGAFVGTVQEFLSWPPVLGAWPPGWSPAGYSSAPAPAPAPSPTPSPSGIGAIPAIGIRANGELLPLIAPAGKLPIVALSASGELVVLFGVTSAPPAVALRASGELVPLL